MADLLQLMLLLLLLMYLLLLLLLWLLLQLVLLCLRHRVPLSRLLLLHRLQGLLAFCQLCGQACNL